MTDREWLNMRALEIGRNMQHEPERKRLLRSDFKANSKLRWMFGRSEWRGQPYQLIPNIRLSIGRGYNHHASCLYEMYGLQELTIRTSVEFFNRGYEWSLTIGRRHKSWTSDVGKPDGNL